MCRMSAAKSLLSIDSATQSEVGSRRSLKEQNLYPCVLPVTAVSMAMMSKKAKRVSVIAKGRLAKAMVFRGSKEKTYTGLKKADLMKTKSGKVVTKKQHAAGKGKGYENIKNWITAVQEGRKALGVSGFQAVKKGSPLYDKIKEIYNLRA